MARWGAVLALACAVRLATWERVAGRDPAGWPFDGDCLYHLLRAEEIARDFPRVPWHDAELGGGAGTDVPWPPLFDELVAATALVLGGGAAGEAEVARAGAWVPVALGVATVPLVAWLAAALAGGDAALGVALLLALSARHAVYSALGRTDQHVLEVLLAIAVLLAHARYLAQRTFRGRAAASVALGAAIATSAWGWLGSTLDLVFLAAHAAAWHVVAPGSSERAEAPAASMAVGCAGGATLLAVSVAALAPGEALLRLEIGGVSGLHVLVTAGAALFAAILWLGRRLRPDAGRGRRTAEVAIAVAAPLCLAVALPPLRSGMEHGLAGLLRGSPWYASISEFAPILFSGGRPLAADLSDAVGRFGLAPLVAAAGAAALRARWRAAPERRPEVLLLATWGGLAFALALARNRFDVYAAAPLAVWCWLGLRHVQASRLPGLSRGAWGAAFLAVGVAATTANALASYVRFVRQPAAVTPGPLLASLRGLPAPAHQRAVYARWDWGHHVRALARRPALANPFGVEGGAEAFEESVRTYLTTEPEEVERVLRARGAGVWLVEDPRRDALFLQDLIPPERRVASVSRGWRAGRVLVEGERYRAMVSYRLHVRDGSAGDGLPALGGFRLVGETAPDDPAASPRPAFALFGLVPGAWLAVTGASPGDEIRAEVEVRSNTGRTFGWRTQARAGPDGRARLRVPYATGANGSSEAGAFEVVSGGRTRIAAVPEAAVLGGAEVVVALDAGAAGDAGVHAAR
ncbi:hypothetical protein [Anaeromyxobacter dehalogenans]|nr:hypothetical protein [Anaeromyxobacter dehalogenans]